MADLTTVDIDSRSATATISLNRPGKLNALSSALLAELGAALEGLSAEFPRVRCVVIAGNGSSFCAGADIREFERWDADSLGEFITLGSRTFGLVASMPQPVVAAVHGHVLGGGLELALACDVRVAATTASLGFPEINIGGVPGWGGTVRLQEIVGRGAASWMMLGGEPIDADTAVALGLVQRVVDPDRLRAAALELAASFAAKSPTALRLVKRALNAGSPFDVPAQAAIEQYANLACMSSDERRQSVHSFGRPPAVHEQSSENRSESHRR